MDYSLLKQIAPIPDISKAKKAVFIGPHPDDIEIGAGGTVKHLINLGADVMFIICTDGGSGILDNKTTVPEIIEKRKNESIKAANYLGVKKIVHLNFPDGGKYDEWDLAMEIVKVLIDFAPDFVICPDPNLPSETHPDHLKCGNASRLATFVSSYSHVLDRNGIKNDPLKIEKSPAKNLCYYYTHRANSYVPLTDSEFEEKLKALKLHRSQFHFIDEESAFDYLGISIYMTERAQNFGEKTGTMFAEGFFALAPFHQHCFTEINDPEFLL
jgi:LmbE family N-acetylglucosaminyl deacetylase